MAGPDSGTHHTITISRVKDAKSRAKVATALARVSRGVSYEQLSQRLNHLPWTLTRKSSGKKAARLVHLLNTLGAEVLVEPPLYDPIPPEHDLTQILPGTTLLSESQVATPTVLEDTKNERSSSETSERPAPPELPPGTAPTAGRTPQPEKPVSRAIQPKKRSETTIKPLTLNQILDQTIYYCKLLFWKLLGILVFPWAVAMAVWVTADKWQAHVGLLRDLSRGLDSIGQAMAWSALRYLDTVSILVLFAAVFMYYVSQAAVVHVVSSAYLGKQFPIGQSYAFAVKRLPGMMVTSVLFLVLALIVVLAAVIGLGEALGLLTGRLYPFVEGVSSTMVSGAITFCLAGLLIVLWAWLLSWVLLKFVLFDKVAIVENISFFKPLIRSRRLMSGTADGPWPRTHYGRLLVLVHLFAFIYMAVYLALWPIGWVVANFATDRLATIAPLLKYGINGIAALAVWVFSSVCLTIFYYDVGTRTGELNQTMLNIVARRVTGGSIPRKKEKG